MIAFDIGRFPRAPITLESGIAEHLERFRPVAERAKADGVRLRAYASTVCGCPYEGRVAVGAVVALVEALRGLGADEISLGDTIGVGHPAQVRELVGAVAGVVPLDRIALHCHDTYGRALANVQAGFEAGVRTFDASLGGLGGCPYAPGASGNLATEDLVYMLSGMGIETGIDLDALVDCSTFVSTLVGHDLPSKYWKAALGERSRRPRTVESPPQSQRAGS